MKVAGTVVLKSGKEVSAKRFHPWIFSGAIQSMEGDPGEGAWVKVADQQKNVLGFGHYQKGSIAVRLSSFAKEPPGERFWTDKIANAYRLRVSSGVANDNTDSYRLIHGEGDGLPGLIVDYYNGVAVLQAHSAGIHNDRFEIAGAIKATLGDRVSAVYYKSQMTAAGKPANEYLLGMGAVPHVIHEHGNKFYVDWEEGQKTGFFLDQRENRKLLGEQSRGKKVLNTFCYTGGFSVYALKSGATLVHSVDASARAVRMTEKNMELNGFDPRANASYEADTFDFFKESTEEYDVIVLDPPAFAKHKDAKHQAMKGYQRLNAEAMRRVKTGGIIFTFSCSQVVDRQLFYDTIVSAAIQTGRDIKVLHHLSQPADHPVSMYHPEGEYLKGLVVYVN